MNKKLVENIFFGGTLKVETGLHIGGLSDSLKIGGLDSPVIRIRRFEGNELPYIPGSSLKGRIRALLTSVYSREEDRKLLDTIFGTANSERGQNDKESLSATRVIFRDAYLKNKIEDIEGITEVKGENQIHPITNRANPRFIERVIPGAEFNVEFILSVYEGDDEASMIRILREGLKLLEDSYLGGSGTRGYGKVKYIESSMSRKTAADYLEEAKKVVG